MACTTQWCSQEEVTIELTSYDLVAHVYVACRPIGAQTGVYTWGWGNDGRLGHGEESYLLVPRLVTGLQQCDISEIACGYYHSMARSDAGVIFTWGAGAHGRLGHGNASDVSTPHTVRSMDHTPVQQISCGGYHTVALAQDGGLWTWGHGANGRLGHGFGESEDTLVPRRVKSPKIKGGIEQIACGEHHTGVRMVDGRVFTWGRGAFGRLGHGEEVDVDTPREVSPCVSRAYFLVCHESYSSLLRHSDSRSSVMFWFPGR